MNSEKKIIHIMASGHSGSTLLDLLLGSHSRGFSLGEFSTLQSPQIKLCSICREHCTFWDQPERKALLSYWFGWDKSAAWLQRRIARFFRQIRDDIFSHLFDWTNALYLVDSSKGVKWIQRQCNQIQRCESGTPFLLYLTRDGRAVVNSYLRKYPNQSAEQLARVWVAGELERQEFFNAFPAHRRIHVTYEELTNNPEATVQAICSEVDAQYEESMLQYWQFDHHTIAGNRGARDLIFQYREKFLDSPLPGWNSKRRTYYDQVGLAIQEDLRWKSELTPSNIAIVEKIAANAQIVLPRC